MKAIEFLGEREARIVDRPDPRPGNGEVLLKLRAAGICGSDLHRYRSPKEDFRGPVNVVPGHEPVGVVIETGPGVRGLKVGDRVMVYHRRGCGECRWCRRGHMSLCQNGQRAHGWGCDGSNAELMVTDDRCCYVLPDDISDEVALVLSCQAGTAYWPLRKLGLTGRDTLAVSGLGPVGLCAVMFGQALGARVIGLDPSEPRRRLAEELGAVGTIDPTNGNLDDAVRAVAPEGADVIVETSGRPSGHAAIPDIAGVEARVGIVGMGSTEPSLNLIRLIWKDLTVVGFNFCPNALVPELIDVTRRHRVQLDRIITHQVPLAEGPAAFQLADQATTGKVRFTFD